MKFPHPAQNSTFPRLQMIFALLPMLLAAPGAVAEEDARPFRFVSGDEEAGRLAFQSLNCVQCHSVADVALEEPKGKRRLNLQLGSELRFVKNYEDLILAITNPQHVIQEQYQAILSKPELAGGIVPLMPDLTEDMSVRQLIDLVAFLHLAYGDSLEGYGK